MNFIYFKIFFIFKQNPILAVALVKATKTVVLKVILRRNKEINVCLGKVKKEPFSLP